MWDGEQTKDVDDQRTLQAIAFVNAIRKLDLWNKSLMKLYGFGETCFSGVLGVMSIDCQNIFDVIGQIPIQKMFIGNGLHSE